MRDHVEGTVTLYAVIQTDGSVDGIRVLNSLDERLDQNAIRALSHWHFPPGHQKWRARCRGSGGANPVPHDIASLVTSRIAQLRVRKVGLANDRLFRIDVSS